MPAPARLIAAALACLPLAPRAHDVVDPERFQQALVDVARAQRQAHAPGADAEAFYGLGEKVEAAVDLLNQQAGAHGEGDLLSRLVAERLRAYGLQLRFSQPERRYASDLGAFCEYLRRAPSGPRAAAAWYRLLDRSFHERAGGDPGDLASADVAAIARAAGEEERFLQRHPDDERAARVRFFLAVDYYRLAMAKGEARRAHFRRLGREALNGVRKRQPGTMEARTAETLLDDLARR